MAQTIQLSPRDTLEILQAKIKSSKDEGQKTRLRVILGIKKGKQRKEIAEDLHLNIDTITDTVKKYNKQGVDGLKTNRGGRPEGNPLWDTSIFDDLIKEIDEQGKYWSIPIMIEWIKKHKGKNIPYNTVWYHMHVLEYTYKSARPHPYKGDKDKQESFKKGVF